MNIFEKNVLMNKLGKVFYLQFLLLYLHKSVFVMFLYAITIYYHAIIYLENFPKSDEFNEKNAQVFSKVF